MRRFATIVLLLCATTHCVLSIFYVNTSWLDLHRYAEGAAPEPFQRRFLMVPILRWAESNHTLQTAAARYGVNVPQPEPMSAAKLASVLISLVLLNCFGLWTTRVSADLSIRHWWLLWVLVLAILYASYAARYEQCIWYPYDIPHLVLFGIATVFLLTGRPLPFVVAFCFDAPMRETSVFLIALALVVHFRSKPWRIAAGACAAVWTLHPLPRLPSLSQRSPSVERPALVHRDQALAPSPNSSASSASSGCQSGLGSGTSPAPSALRFTQPAP